MLDAVSLAVVYVMWMSFALVMDHSRWSKITLTASVNVLRTEWMRRMVNRENRVADSALMGNLMRSMAFFASASIIILGGVAALAGAAERAWEAIESIPFITHTSRDLFEFKVMMLGMIFIYSFFKFTWGMRQFNYCCILVGAAPTPSDMPDEKEAYIRKAARVNELGARSFNQGLRGYYFALSSLGWFLHPLAFVAGALAVVLILWRREFHSKTRLAFRGQKAKA